MMSPTPSDLGPRGRSPQRLTVLLASALLGVACGCKRGEDPGRNAPAAPSSGALEGAVQASSSSPTEPADSPPDTAGPAEAVGSVDLPGALLPPERRAGDESAAAICGDYGVPCPDELVHLCGRRELVPGGARVSWDAFAADALVEEVGAVLRARLGERGLVEDSSGLRWTLPGSAGAAARRIEVISPDAQARHTRCDTRPPASARSVLVLSREE